MNFRRWFAWACLALMVIAEVALFRAYRDRDGLQTALNNTQAELRQLTTERDALKNSNAGLQAAEISRLRKQNQILTNQVAQWRASLEELNFESRSNAVHLATARTALQLQQQHLAELQVFHFRHGGDGLAGVERPLLLGVVNEPHIVHAGLARDDFRAGVEDLLVLILQFCEVLLLELQRGARGGEMHGVGTAFKI